jgi:hypothetical protein
MQAAVMAAGAAFVALLAIGASVVDWFLNLGSKAWEAGTALVDGLIQGITGAAGKLVQTVQNLAGDALKAFKSVFKIQSPSRVMMGVGENISLGLAEGIAAGSPAVNDNMVAAVEPVAPPQARAQSTGASGSVSVSGNEFHFHFPNISNAEQLREEMPSIMADALEQAAMSKGLNPSNPQAA